VLNARARAREADIDVCAGTHHLPSGQIDWMRSSSPVSGLESLLETGSVDEYPSIASFSTIVPRVEEK
jgi:hypothetical protein